MSGPRPTVGSWRLDAAAYLPAGLRCIMGWGGTSMELNFEGIAVGAASLLVIGAFHPLVIWCEYHFSQKIWPLFLLCGLICLGLALFAHGCSLSFGTCGRGFSLEHPGTERTGTAGRAGMVSQKSQANLTQERRGVPDYG